MSGGNQLPETAQKGGVLAALFNSKLIWDTVFISKKDVHLIYLDTDISINLVGPSIKLKVTWNFYE